MMLAKSQGTWWFDLAFGSYNDNGIMAGVAEAYRAFQKDLSAAAPPEADVALIVGERSLDYLSQPRGNTFRWYLLRRSRDKWDLAGVPYHLHLQSDLPRPLLHHYRVYVFLAPQHLTPEEVAAVERLKRDGKTLVFLHAPGIVGAADPASAIRRLTGLRVRSLPGERKYQGTYVSGSHPLQAGLAGDFGHTPIPGSFPAAHVAGPAFAVDDPHTVSLATYRETGGIAWAARDFGAWRSVFCGVARIESQFLHNVARWGKAWTVSDPGDAVYANQHFITIHAVTEGEKTLHLRRPSRVVDLTSGDVVAEQTGSVRLRMERGRTRWFALEPVR
jgi:hypothetical protein